MKRAPQALTCAQPSLLLRPRSDQCWFRRFLSSVAASDPRWTQFFRMSEPSFTLLLRLLIPSLDSAVVSVAPTNVLAAALFRLAHGAPYKSLACRFSFDSSADACHAFLTICHSINLKLGHLFELRSDSNRVWTDFGWLSLPNCCGVLGLGRFKVSGEISGQNSSLLVQALVDSKGRFLDVSVGWPSNLKLKTILAEQSADWMTYDELHPLRSRTGLKKKKMDFIDHIPKFSKQEVKNVKSANTLDHIA
ncbi:hypothetical protein L484_022363 [Morus notabilis]|uniref:Uncharacterized protein n=1 Tax=Morus notabilis TaxID=981085 RepID=W9QRN4_9ROSA|nr:hypothetical protein L484_022363 [Morus notabilis]